ncbi:MAG: 23S rRNA (adenine(2503)-C(2))-methyltransferase RlmN, partial [Bacteroidota bacterium]|nr:23S rRNA (adenine(2503)-C(2))-methyltransferase RlmN [Bacteroidota bacterium]
VNLIEYNPVEGSGFERSPEANVRMFTAYLESRNLVVNIRQSRGKDINAACGQLAARLQCKMMIE